MSRYPKITDEEEQELNAMSKRGEWVSVGNVEEQRAFWQKVARDWLDGETSR